MRKSLIQISENITKLKRKLKKDTSALSLELYRRIREVAVSELPWNDPLENQITSDDSDIIRLLPDELQNIFMVALQNVNLLGTTSTYGALPFINSA
ncbi:266_t:CDS:2 [Entrophospora sp. SA101]|nr:17960_t:CDS:2 [Entrophospora sp. SA101]CAJ0754105.1 336_t:CDS:2 [Entrophospora sp. SA101]CAJ0760268.1 266_t:CDS:2 [Entrophospora sp. SA101]